MIELEPVAEQAAVQGALRRGLAELSRLPAASRALDDPDWIGLEASRTFHLLEFPDVHGLLQGEAPARSVGVLLRAEGDKLLLAQLRPSPDGFQLIRVRRGRGVDALVGSLESLCGSELAGAELGVALAAATREGLFAWVLSGAGQRLFWPSVAEPFGLPGNRALTRTELAAAFTP